MQGVRVTKMARVGLQIRVCADVGINLGPEACYCSNHVTCFVCGFSYAAMELFSVRDQCGGCITRITTAVQFSSVQFSSVQFSSVQFSVGDSHRKFEEDL
jgi:hypothetical protein